MGVWCDWKGILLYTYEDIGVFQLYSVSFINQLVWHPFTFIHPEISQYTFLFSWIRVHNRSPHCGPFECPLVL